MGLVSMYSKQSALSVKYERLRKQPRKELPDQEERVRPRRARRMVDATLEEMVGLYIGGASTYELAEAYETTRERIVYYIKRAGVALRPGPQSVLDDAAKREIARLYPEGWTLHRLAVRFGTSDNTVLKALRAQQIPTRRQPRT